MNKGGGGWCVCKCICYFCVKIALAQAGFEPMNAGCGTQVYELILLYLMLDSNLKIHDIRAMSL